APIFRHWLQFIAEADGAVCISRAVAQELAAWLGEHGPPRLRPYRISWFHLGADVKQSAPTRGMPEGAPAVLAALRARPSFLMVATIEPRKGHAQTLAAFEQLWARGVEANLVFVGKAGWRVEALLERLRSHPEAGRRLYWLEGISDEYLDAVYAASRALIAASLGEGFGLPLIEAARHRVPIIARDIPVFREVAGEHAFYFADDHAPETIARAVEDWLALDRQGRAPQSAGMPYLTWAESAEQLFRRIAEIVERVELPPEADRASTQPTLWRLLD
ncbi:MAG: glycosyltransferase family 4 protein, partial [Casimicrobiaceae bacterium]